MQNISVSRMQGNPLKKYMARAVGSERYIDLVKYEIITCLFRNFPGALGILLRRKTYGWIIGKYGKGTVFFEGITLRCPKQLHIGNNVLIDEGVYFDIKSDKAFVEIGSSSQIMRGVSFESGYEGFIHLGENAFIGPYTILNGQGGLKIGKNALIAGHCYIVAGNHDYSDISRPINRQNFISKGIVLEDDVWLGAGVKILDGVKIGKGSVISAGAVVNQNVEPYSIMGGVPAKFIKSRLKNLKKAEK